MPASWQLSVIEHWGTRYVVELMLGHFRQLSTGNAVTISAEQAELSTHNSTHRVESAWRPGHVLRLDRAATAGRL